MSKLYSLETKIDRLAAAEAELGKHRIGSKTYFAALDEYEAIEGDLRIAIREYEKDDYKPAAQMKHHNVVMICRAYGIRYSSIVYETPEKEASAE